jgi:hypothetical protein
MWQESMSMSYQQIKASRITKNPQAALALAAAATLAASAGGKAMAAVITVVDATAYSQDFNTLAATGTSSTVPSGWEFSESGTGANTTYAASNGSGGTAGTNTYTIAANTYSFGASSGGSTAERSLGTSRDATTLSSMFGVGFVNNSGRVITGLSISYNGEQWSLGEKARASADRLDFQYSVNSATSVTSGTWTDYNALDYSTSKTGGNAGVMDGNANGNHAIVSSTITGTNIASGQQYWLRWSDFDVAGVDDALGVDDFSISAQFANNTTVALTALSAAGAVVNTAPAASTINFGRVMVSGSALSSSATLTKAGSDATTYTIAATGSAGSSSAGASFATGNGATANFNVTLNRSAAGARIGSITIDNTASSSENAGQGSSDVDDVINVSATAVNNRTIAATSVALGRIMVNTASADQGTTLSSSQVDDVATRVSVGGVDKSASVSGQGTITLKGAAADFDYSSLTGSQAPASFVRNVSGLFTTTGSKSGTANFTPNAEGLAGEAPASFGIAYSATVVDNRVVTSNNGTAGTAVNFGRVIVGNGVTAAGDLRSVNSSSFLANVTVNNVDGLLVNGEVKIAGTLNSAIVYNGINGTTSTNRTLSGNFSTSGVRTGNVQFSMTNGTLSAELTGQTVTPVNVFYTATALNNRVVTGTAVNFGSVIGGGAVSGTSNLATTLDDNNATRVTVATTAGADSNGIGVTGGSGTLFNSASAVGTRSVGGTFGSAAGPRSGSFTLLTTGEGLAGESPVDVSVSYSGAVLDHANASLLSDVDTDTILIDFGSVAQNSVQSAPFSLYNLLATAGYTAGLDLDSILESDDTSGVFSSDLATFANLAAGSNSAYSVLFDTSTLGSYSASYTLGLSDQDLPGATGGQTLTVNVQGSVVPEPASGLLLLGGGLLGGMSRRRRK